MVAVSAAAGRFDGQAPVKLHLMNAEVGLRPVGAIGAYAPEGMWNAASGP
jgi:hypothetical protein